MAAALIQSRKGEQELLFNVIGVDLLHEDHYWKIARAITGQAPVSSSDSSIDQIYTQAPLQGNFTATYSETAYQMADVIIVDVNVDVNRVVAGDIREYSVSLDGLRRAITSIGQNMRANSLVLVETTLPPGTTEKVIAPLLRAELKKRQLPEDEFGLAYSFERVMPGNDYLASILAFHRAFAGIDQSSAERVNHFLSSFIDTTNFPLRQLKSTTACEMAKVLENSYRATNIAFIDEWTRFSQEAGVDLYEIVDSIRVRPTHSNIMKPGFGVGGYCLTKDALLGDWSLKNLFHSQSDLDFSRQAIAVNDRMPEQVMGLIEKIFPRVKGIRAALLGVSYRPDVADTRNTPAAYFSDLCLTAGMSLSFHDPLVSFWSERNISISTELDEVNGPGLELLIFALPDKMYQALNAERIQTLFPEATVVIDANDVLSDSTARSLFQRGIRVAGVGKGHWNPYWKVKYA